VEQQQDLQKRLLLALVLSFAVFILFDMFVPKTPKNIDNNSSKTQLVQETHKTISTQVPKSTTQSAQVAKPSISNAPITTTKSIATVTSDRFIYSIDDIGRIAQVKLLEKKYKYNGKALELFNPDWVKPLEIRFADQKLNSEALKTPYTASSSNINLDADNKSLVLTQKLSSTTVTKTLKFYRDGHYDLDISTSIFF